MRIYFTYFLLFLPLMSSAAGFDCSLVKTDIDQTICKNKKLSQLDEKLNVTYQAVLEVFPAKGYIKEEQREWLEALKNTICEKDCSKELISIYKARIDDLKSKLDTTIEKTISKNSELSQLDHKLNIAYLHALKTFPVKGFIKEEQREWLEYLGYTSCKLDCSKELIKKYKDRINELNLPKNAKIYANTLNFEYSSGDAVIRVIPVGKRNFFKVWGGYRHHIQNSIDNNRPIYIGCPFYGLMNTSSSAYDQETKTLLHFKMTKKDLVLKNSDLRAPCAGFGVLPQIYQRVR